MEKAEKTKENNLKAKKLGDLVWSKGTEEGARKNAFEKLKVMAICGNGQAQFECGRIYNIGETFWNGQTRGIIRVPDPVRSDGAGIVEPDYRIATFYFDAAIRNGISEAAERAAYLYRPDWEYGFWKNRRKAVEYCIKGIILHSMICSGRLYRFLGDDHETAGKLTKLALEQPENEIERYLDRLEENGYFH